MPPKSQKNPQWQVRLDAYHRFVVRRLKNLRGTDRSAVLEQMIVAWVSDHPHQVEQAGASLAAWDEVRGEEDDGGKEEHR